MVTITKYLINLQNILYFIETVFPIKDVLSCHRLSQLELNVTFKKV